MNLRNPLLRCFALGIPVFAAGCSGVLGLDDGAYALMDGGSEAAPGISDQGETDAGKGTPEAGREAGDGSTPVADSSAEASLDARSDVTLPQAEAGESLVLVTVSGVGSCTGVVLEQGSMGAWVLVAGHCLTELSGVSPQLRVDGIASDVNIRAQVAGLGDAAADPILVDRHYFFGGFPGDELLATGGALRDWWQGPDLALVHLATAANLIDSALFVGGASEVVGQTLEEFGVMPDLSVTKNAITPTSWDDGIASSGARYYVPLDAGAPDGDVSFTGPDFAVPGARSIVAGIPSGLSWTCTADASTLEDCPPANRSDIVAFSTSVSEVSGWIDEVLGQKWDATRSAQAITIGGNELDHCRATFRDVEATSWANADRAAATICFDRGFGVGLFDGSETPDAGTIASAVTRTYGVLCLGGGIQYFDEPPNDGGGQDDAIPWAQAARSAHSLCAAQQGFSTGLFNGYATSASVGLLCIPSDEAEIFSAPSTATGISDVDSVTWAAGARAASAFCQEQAFVGGFMNGTQSNGNQGIVCLR